MKRSSIIIILIIFLRINSIGQVHPKESYHTVLQKAQIDREYRFDKSAKDEYDRLDLVYLGKIKTRRGKVLKILTSRWYWGQVPRATSRIIIFNQNNQYLGDYHLTMTYEVPERIEKGILIFKLDKKDGSLPKPITKVNFINGIPKQFFLATEDSGAGTIYCFAQNLVFR